MHHDSERVEQHVAVARHEDEHLNQLLLHHGEHCWVQASLRAEGLQGGDREPGGEQLDPRAFVRVLGVAPCTTFNILY